MKFNQFLNQQAGNGPSRRPAQGSQKSSFFNVKRHYCENVTKFTVQCRKIPEGTPIRLKHRFLPYWKHRKTIFESKLFFGKSLIVLKENHNY